MINELNTQENDYRLYPSRHCDEHRLGWCEGRRSNLKRLTIQVRKEIASSPESFRDPRNDVSIYILVKYKK